MNRSKLGFIVESKRVRVAQLVTDEKGLEWRTVA